MRQQFKVPASTAFNYLKSLVCAAVTSNAHRGGVLSQRELHVCGGVSGSRVLMAKQ